MLFNTLTYAKFFAIVFTTAWLLANRRWAPLLPWLALAFTAAFAFPGVQAAVLVVALFGPTWMLSRADVPTVRRALASVSLNLAALCYLSVRHTGLAPLTLALRGLGVPAPGSTIWIVLSIVASVACGTALVTARRVRLLFILFASYAFYAHWDWHFLPLIFGSSTIDWLLGNAIAREERPARRKQLVAATVALNLGVLGVFKYFNFGVEALGSLLGALGLHAPRSTLELALPIGISFFTFESMSYVIDVYRRHLPPQKSYVEYLSFVAFFPHLVAGPIVRPKDLLPQLAGPPVWNPKEGSEGLFLIAMGLVKKVAIGDYLALNLVDRVFDTPAHYSALECYSGVLGYAVQIYCDFSGYTDIAIGSALLLGVRFPLNFDAPYKATDIQDFWRRWHISLSTWLRDYLYIPLGGNRKGSRRTYVNLMLTMLLGGLWHGAAWNFVVWGGLHGVALAVTRAWHQRHHRVARTGHLRSVVTAALTFHFVCAAWIFFRAHTFQQATSVFSQLSTLTTFHPNLGPSVLGVLAAGLLSHWVPERWYAGAQRAFIEAPAVVQGAVLFAAAVLVSKMASADAVPFVYFQF